MKDYDENPELSAAIAMLAMRENNEAIVDAIERLADLCMDENACPETKRVVKEEIVDLYDNAQYIQDRIDAYDW